MSAITSSLPQQSIYINDQPAHTRIDTKSKQIHTLIPSDGDTKPMSPQPSPPHHNKHSGDIWIPLSWDPTEDDDDGQFCSFPFPSDWIQNVRTYLPKTQSVTKVKQWPSRRLWVSKRGRIAENNSLGYWVCPDFRKPLTFSYRRLLNRWTVGGICEKDSQNLWNEGLVTSQRWLVFWKFEANNRFLPDPVGLFVSHMNNGV